MADPSRDNWVTTKVRRTLHDEIGRALRTEEARRNGLTNTAQFVDTAVRELLERCESDRFNHVNMYDDHVKILDNRLERVGRIVSVYFRRGRRSWCDYCEAADCVHVQYAWELPDVKEKLAGQGLTPPPSKI